MIASCTRFIYLFCRYILTVTMITELRHTWTDGRLKSPRLTFNGTMSRQRWAWESIGEPVPEIGTSFIPWCSASQCHDNDANCLNLDRTGYDTPIVYGLPCNQSQTYVCQPRKYLENASVFLLRTWEF